ncbi:UDP-N-acetylmuramoylalanine--D-glutamate ligase [Acaryochloris thomasi RCC1774]|uniref:UDP-N-acetylmuramoylalanine--D-glutamate ligase n=1 Tax=Acaryochloris thomasi RCC1774 TaxID=1764569 RepID=A0A2W1JP04_9CYAN|nr:UDP-N-acetylmuramoyl-L-alanine--D-glutamate ligase [Acaryochloris thomasi]PZD71884.1 UDP-N-acetylmuramoylalanine--D-glutamate ligase [Acaryochloris thomasi RCC1774]
MPTAHIIGLGRSGITAARLLNKDKWQVSVSDAGQSEKLSDLKQKLESEGITVALGARFDLEVLAAAGMSRPDRIVVSPGVSWQLPSLVAAREQGIEAMGEMELAWRYLKHRPWVGITGTNGKTTTTAITAAIFQAAGLQAPACGNIGNSASELALSGKTPDWVIAEVSSYQSESSSTLAPNIGVWTTLSPDHLERHGTLERYGEIKALLLHRSQQRVLNGDDDYLRNGLMARWPNASWTSTQGSQAVVAQGKPQQSPIPMAYLESGWVMVEGQQMLPTKALRMRGTHNQQNLLMAVAVAHLAGIERDAIATAIQNFPGVPHRLEHICTWQGIDFINDSKATNYEAAQTGLAAVEGPAILIAGGEAKDGDDTDWLRTIQSKAATVLLIGRAAPNFAQRLETLGYIDYEIVDTMENALPRAIKLARELQARTVLLSPACASFDQYQNFERRGDHFRQLCPTNA